MFGRHPAIKEEPTTPGGSLQAETPTPPLGGVATKRMPFGLGKLSPASQEQQHLTQPHFQQQPAQFSSDQLGQIKTILDSFKLELRQDLVGALAADQLLASERSRRHSRRDSGSKSPHRAPPASGQGEMKHQHRRHHHHLKADHSTPSQTPDASRLDLATGANKQLLASSSVINPNDGDQEQRQQVSATAKKPPDPVPSSSAERSDDDQDATSKL